MARLLVFGDMVLVLPQSIVHPMKDTGRIIISSSTSNNTISSTSSSHDSHTISSPGHPDHHRRSTPVSIVGIPVGDDERRTTLNEKKDGRNRAVHQVEKHGLNLHKKRTRLFQKTKKMDRTYVIKNEIVFSLQRRVDREDCRVFVQLNAVLAPA